MILLAIALCLTNTAGRVVSAEPLSISAATVELRLAGDTQPRQLPLSLFPASERRRIAAALGQHSLPSGLAEVRRIFVADLERAEARAQAGEMDEKALADKRSRVLAGWAWSVEKPKYGLTEAEKAYWKGHLR